MADKNIELLSLILQCLALTSSNSWPSSMDTPVVKVCNGSFAMSSLRMFHFGANSFTSWTITWTPTLKKKYISKYYNFLMKIIISNKEAKRNKKYCAKNVLYIKELINGEFCCIIALNQGPDHVQVFWKQKSIGKQASDWLT